MPRTPPAHVEPSVLAWARESLGLAVDEAARRMAVKPEKVAAWEAGESRPTIAQLRKAADVYKRPLAVFFLPEPPRGFDALRDFRLLPDTAEGPWSPELRLALRRAQGQQEAAAELLELLGANLPELPSIAADFKDPESTGASLREALAFPLERQYALPASQPHAAFKAWAVAVEDLGVLIMHARGVEIAEMRGFSLSEPVPTICVNGSDSPRGRLFTLLHEMAHLVIHATGICDTRDREPTQSESARIEVFCNQVAAATLMPREPFASFADGLGVEGAEWPDEQIAALSGRFAVSREAALRRLVTLGKSNRAFYERKRKEFLEEYEAARARERERDGGPTYYRLKVGELGHAYIDLALETHAQGLVNRLELADLLDVKVRQIDAIVSELQSRGPGAA